MYCIVLFFVLFFLQVKLFLETWSVVSQKISWVKFSSQASCAVWQHGQQLTEEESGPYRFGSCPCGIAGNTAAPTCCRTARMHTDLTSIYANFLRANFSRILLDCEKCENHPPVKISTILVVHTSRWQSQVTYDACHMTVTCQLPFPELYLRKVHILLPPEDIKLVSVKHTATLVQKGRCLLPFSLLLWPLLLNPRPHFLQGFLTSCPERSNKKE